MISQNGNSNYATNLHVNNINPISSTLSNYNFIQRSFNTGMLKKILYVTKLPQFLDLNSNKFGNMRFPNIVTPIPKINIGSNNCSYTIRFYIFEKQNVKIYFKLSYLRHPIHKI